MSTKYFMHWHNFAHTQKIEYSTAVNSLAFNDDITWEATITVGALTYDGEGKTKQGAKDAAGKAALLAHDVDISFPESAHSSQESSAPEMKKRWYMHAHNHVRKSDRTLEATIESSGPSHDETWTVSLRVGNHVYYGQGKRRQEAKDSAAKALLVAEGVDVDALTY